MIASCTLRIFSISLTNDTAHKGSDGYAYREGRTWTIWRAPGEDWNGPDGPGFNQRFIGEISADGDTIEGRWERGLGDAGDAWELDFPLTYVRR